MWTTKNTLNNVESFCFGKMYYARNGGGTTCVNIEIASY
jgi:hypothetical protein